jgi:hypothetical protein
VVRTNFMAKRGGRQTGRQTALIGSCSTEEASTCYARSRSSSVMGRTELV